jgi:hypothetical protein
MVARQPFADYIDTLLVGRYARLVNRDDGVARIPSSHVACGSLVWFTDSGVKRSKPKRIGLGASAIEESTAADAADKAARNAEITPMTEAEFKSLQAKLKAENATKERLPEGSPVEYQAMSSMFDDHSMSLYLDKVRTLLGVRGSAE